MVVRSLSGLLLMLCTFMSMAGQPAWLTQMITEREGARASVRQEVPVSHSSGFWRTHGLILFYGSQCPHCRQFAPTLKAWADRNGAGVLPLAFDNQPLPEFPRFLPATTEWVNAAFQGSAISYPALFVMHPKTNALYPVGFGAMSHAEINERIAMMIPKIEAYEQHGSIK
ncbi:type-F conjugative transfer system pilin assembly thiol-disulfide isomerase TrbB (plasmid) [Legionella geestiana]|uniref:type-F conjugative transfer system pilin assembly thiol-disulfide isomerase TrbB n=1 Tax=Legionella geestiana TaxID=45065 RepID=UPI0010928387|nr:type-F conjugative transfer system pilin assembly thiol-disulfide isomerase TrbB [Legionella geestiana]QDQ41165.1 type-F conjugative transfer system pilin assembly thiol-disulfide isomerase TrbB [Legionella geestiana]